jgi:glutathione S-transferase
MTYDLYIGDRSFSSWSLRGWLMFEKFDIACRTHLVGLYSGTMKQDLAPLAPAYLVPVIRTPDGTVVGDTMAIAETLAERHSDIAMWPKDPKKRATARWMVAEMHGGFQDLRTDCPMQLLGQLETFSPSDGVLRDLARLEKLWAPALAKHQGDWLFGDYSLADVFFSPIAARIAGFGLPVSAPIQAYVDAHLSDKAFRRWRSLGLTKSYDPVPYIEGQNLTDWPGPKPQFAQIATGPSINNSCPYSGKPVSNYLKLDGKVWGFCNPTCRDKTLNDPEAWPEFMQMVEREAP